MKTTYTQILLNLMVCFSLFTLSNCNDDCGPTPKVLIKDLGKYVPYTGNDTLRFLRNSTDTQTFVGQGMERFYVTTKEQEDDACPEDHESVRIRFKNTQNNNEIKMEYVFDITDFNEAGSFDNIYTYYKFYFNNLRYGARLSKSDLQYTNIDANNKSYNYIRLFYYPQNSKVFFAYRRPVDNTFSGLIKIITLDNDTFEVIQ